MNQKPRRTTKKSGLSDGEITELLDDPRVQAMIRAAAEQESLRPVSSTQQTTINARVDLIRAQFTDEQIERARQWVMMAFQDMINPRQSTPHVLVCVVYASPRTRRMGITTSPDGEVIPHSFEVDCLAGMFIEPILDESLQTEEERILAMTSPEQHEALERYGIEFPWEMEWLYSEKDGKRVPELWTHHIK